jgi:hypothetical protein
MVTAEVHCTHSATRRPGCALAPTEKGHLLAAKLLESGAGGFEVGISTP